jgi:hypothetical protein
MKLKIIEVQYGWGETSLLFRVGSRYDKKVVARIECHEETVGKGLYNDLTMNVFYIYDMENKLICTLNEPPGVSVYYE